MFTEVRNEAKAPALARPRRDRDGHGNAGRDGRARHGARSGKHRRAPRHEPEDVRRALHERSVQHCPPQGQPCPLHGHRAHGHQPQDRGHPRPAAPGRAGALGHPGRLQAAWYRSGPDRRDRGRVRRLERRVRPGHVPLVLRAAAVHHRQRLLPEDRPERRHQLPAGRLRLGPGDLARPGRGVLRLPQLPHPAGGGRRQQHRQPRYRRGHRGVHGREVRVQLLRHPRRGPGRTRLRPVLHPPGRGGRRLHR